MIKKLEVDDIAKILSLDDPIEQIFPCDKGEWVQWLMQNIENPEILIIGRVSSDELDFYAVAVNYVLKPLSDSIGVILFSKGAETNSHIREQIIEWGKKKGAKKVIFQATERSDLEKINTDNISYIGHWVV